MKKEKNYTFKPSSKAKFGLMRSGIIDGRDGTVRKDRNLSGLINMLLEQHLADHRIKTLIEYNKSRVAELNEQKEKLTKQQQEISEENARLREIQVEAIRKKNIPTGW